MRFKTNKALKEEVAILQKELYAETERANKAETELEAHKEKEKALVRQWNNLFVYSGAYAQGISGALQDGEDEQV